MIQMKGFCPECVKKTELEEINAKEQIEVRGESFMVLIHYFRCSVCGEEFLNLSDPVDPLDAAYRQYREKHGWLQPEEIEQFRKSYHFTQKELAAILSLGDVTLSRYENGALQDAAHEKLLRTAMDPQILLKWMEQTPEAIPNNNKREEIIRNIKGQLDQPTEKKGIFWAHSWPKKNAPDLKNWCTTSSENYSCKHIEQLAA